MAFTFDGPNKLIIEDVAVGDTTVNIQDDVYEAWKSWVLTDDNAKYLQALRTVGGDPTVGANTVSPYFFLMNGWKIRPYEGDHEMELVGNLFVDGGGSPMVSTVGDFNVLVTRTLSVNAVNVETGVSGLTTEESSALTSTAATVATNLDAKISEVQVDVDLDLASIADAVWDEMRVDHTTAGSYGQFAGEPRVEGIIQQNVGKKLTKTELEAIAKAVWEHLVDKEKTAQQTLVEAATQIDLTPIIKQISDIDIPVTDFTVVLKKIDEIKFPEVKIPKMEIPKIKDYTTDLAKLMKAIDALPKTIPEVTFDYQRIEDKLPVLAGLEQQVADIKTIVEEQAKEILIKVDEKDIAAVELKTDQALAKLKDILKYLINLKYAAITAINDKYDEKEKELTK